MLLYTKSGVRRRNRTYDRTTLTLVVMLAIFIVSLIWHRSKSNLARCQTTELPQGIIAVLNGIYTNHVHRYIYQLIGDGLDLLSLINCYVG